ncbi:MAG: dynamin family protein, partial [Heliobacteriaceae bacterium]|nr:dynamin family protein [Heliobacteriaceae bacterium]
ASEEKACFVEWIELYYDCPLTAQGIMLVDTPGADSLNTRHTGLAFDYIKNADAILFVTYFNSAFSHADRDFLYQLGRVKDSFTLDKMFFVVNAADLAKTGAELAAVTEHVNNNVTACGIRDPRIFPVSSQTALLAKMAAAGPLPASLEKTYRQRVTSLLAQSQTEPVKMDSELPSRQQGLDLSGFAAFEQAFFQFTLTDLTAVAVRAAQGELHRCLGTLEAMIATARSDSSARLIRQAAYTAACTGLHRSLQRVDTAAELKMLDRETGELVYYVKQRLFFRFGDIFNRFFNPAVLQDTRGVMTKKAFRQSLEALVQTLEMGLIQEVRATSLHIEKFINQRSARFRDKLARVVAETTPQCTLQAFEPVSMPTPEFSGQSLTLDTTAVLPLLTRIKNPKDFFEGQGRANFRQELTTHLETQVATAVATAEAMLREFYTTAFQ